MSGQAATTLHPQPHQHNTNNNL